MKLYILRHRQELPISVDEAWDFLSDPSNLERITPPSMQFITLSGHDRKMFPGQIIHYKISLLPGFFMQWVTEITHLEHKKYFVDEQRYGPYKFWHHKHFIKEVPGGVELEDIIHYKVPLGFLGDIFHPLLVKPKLEEIFRFRKDRLRQMFGEMEKGDK